MRNTTVDASYISDTTVQLRFELGNIVDAVQSTQVPAGLTPDDDGWVREDGEIIGRVGGRDGDTFMGLDRLERSVIEDLFEETDGQAPVDTADRWTVLVNGEEVDVASVSRKSNILDTAFVGNFEFDFRTLENVFLELEQPLAKGDAIEVRFDDPDFAPVETNVRPDQVVSEAVHVNLKGFDPDDAVKVAYLSSWNGFDAGDDSSVAATFETGQPFRVVDEATGKTVQRGEITLAQGADDPSDFARNYQLADLYEMDFSALDEEGTYHVVVNGVGRSPSFEITEDHWSELFEVSFSGFYHQRSGLALEEPYTDWERPRSLHPDDGVVVQQTTVELSETNQGYDNSQPPPRPLFEDNTTGEVLDDAFGGWHDAGDWDRRTQHIETSRKLMELVELEPEFAESTDGSIPESGDAVPDLIDEALWNLDLFRRMQKEDGGVPGGIESADNPRYGDGSWGESQEVYAYAPEAWSSWEYAAAAAKAADLLETYDPEAAQMWRDSAVDAMNWAEANYDEASYDATHVRARNIAAVELYDTTGNARWHDLYKETSSYSDPDAQVDWSEQQYEAAFVYALTDRESADADLQQQGADAIEGRAEFLTGDALRSGFGYTNDPYAPYGWGATGTQPNESADIFARAHALTGNEAYFEQLQADVQYALGANPLNMSYMTGLGVREPEEILNLDADALGAIPPGITLYGDYSVHDYGRGFYHDIMDEPVFPDFEDVPVSESFNAFFYFVPSTEYTVQQGIQDMTFVTGYLAAQQDDASEPQTTLIPIEETAADPLIA